MHPFSSLFLQSLLVAAMSLASLGSLNAQQTETEQTEVVVVTEVIVITTLDEEGRLVRFERDIAPILRDRCLECHGPEEAKNDFRVDDLDSLMQYVEPGDVESSTMYVDYLVSNDEDSMMPPASHDGPLSVGELALIRVWIEEGAVWPEGYVLEADLQDATPPKAVEKPAAPNTLGARIWAFQGFFHPATVHFPIAFFLLGGGFVVLGWKWPSVGTQIPLACLLLGSLSAIAATLMGWSFAPEQGYGSGWNPLDWSREIDVHRWSGAIVTLLSVVLAIIALIAMWKDSNSMNKTWKVGLLFLAGMVGAVGHQGGELSYGKNFYPKAFRILLGSDDQSASAAEPTQPDTDPADGAPEPESP